MGRTFLGCGDLREMVSKNFGTWVEMLKRVVRRKRKKGV
jgi:hypothetical protein